MVAGYCSLAVLRSRKALYNEIVKPMGVSSTLNLKGRAITERTLALRKGVQDKNQWGAKVLYIVQ